MIPLVTLRQFLNDMRRQKLRTAMTMFGIFWGTCSIVLLFAFGNGITQQQIKQQKGMGENIAIFWPGITAKEYKGLPKGRRIIPTEDDVKLIKMKARTIGRISAEYSKWNVNLRVGKNSTIRNIVGVWPEFGEMRNVIPAEGSRFLNDRDQDEKRRVIFIGDLLAKDLFGDKKPVGEEILVNGTPFVVIGVMQPKKQNSSYSGRDSRKAFIPASTFQTMYSRRYLNDFVAQCKPGEGMEYGKKEIYQILSEKYRFDPSDKDALSVWDTTRGFAFLHTFFLAFRAFLVGIGIATLITGGIGVSNIMNVVLEERTKEIGIKMALGARKSFVLWQFVFETLLITGFGGLFGFLFAWGIIIVFPMLHLDEYVGIPTVNIWGSIGIVIVLGIVGLIAGIFPARRAANLQPVQALKLF
ncbi:MAG TPA: ABC transporter permease [candidate division Zixibacteria bacterium]|nr:ABC transporter permease [candidate division Zixibacteria bacterium]